jgi:hypothetical protein
MAFLFLIMASSYFVAKKLHEPTTIRPAGLYTTTEAITIKIDQRVGIIAGQ